jgi:DNA-damage-inducible protein J
MTSRTSMLHVRVDDRLKTEAAERLSSVGLTISDAVRILLTRVAREGALPASLAVDPDAYDAWFRAKVQEAIADTRPPIQHDQVMNEAQALIDKKRPARSVLAAGARRDGHKQLSPSLVERRLPCCVRFWPVPPSVGRDRRPE